MTDPREPQLFDEYADEYDRDLVKGISISGEGKEFFARERIRWLRRCLGASTDGFRIMDYGCGIGSSTPYFFDYLKAREVVGLDISPRSVCIARERQGGDATSFNCVSEFVPDASFDMVFSNGVFHHIAVSERDAAVRFLVNCLKLGGVFVLWENNPWNLGTHIVMHRIPFDADARKISPNQAVRLIARNSCIVESVTFAFIFPNILRNFRWIEPSLSKWPLGAQYQVLARKPH